MDTQHFRLMIIWKWLKNVYEFIFQNICSEHHVTCIVEIHNVHDHSLLSKHCFTNTCPIVKDIQQKP